VLTKLPAFSELAVEHLNGMGGTAACCKPCSSKALEGNRYHGQKVPVRYGDTQTNLTQARACGRSRMIQKDGAIMISGRPYRGGCCCSGVSAKRLALSFMAV